MSNATIIAAAFGEGANLYDILGVAHDATPAQLRKAYYRKSLACHPDKVGAGKEDIFQATTVAYNILKNEETRNEYNETGELVDDDDDDDDINSFDAMKSYFKSVFGTVTTSKIDQFAQQYKCSEEEESHVLQYYKQFKGNLLKMLENVMLSTERDAQRWVEDYLQPAMESGEVPMDYKKTLDRTLAQCRKKLEKETADVEEEEEVEVMEVEAQVDDDDDDETESDNTDDEAKPVAAKKKKPVVAKKKAPAKKKKQAKKKSKAQREAEEAEALMAKIRGKKTLANRKQGFDSMLGSLAAKYGGSDEDNNGDGDPLDDAAFERIQANMKTNKKKKKTKWWILGYRQL